LIQYISAAISMMGAAGLQSGRRRLAMATTGSGVRGVMLAAIIAVVASPTGTADVYRHDRCTSIYGPAPAYWGVRATGATARRSHDWAPLNAGAASASQLGGRLRRRGDGDLAEALINSPTPQSERVLDRYGIPVVADVPPVAYLRGAGKRPRFFFRGHRR
jgi:hypothetical protein